MLCAAAVRFGFRRTYGESRSISSLQLTAAERVVAGQGGDEVAERRALLARPPQLGGSAPSGRNVVDDPASEPDAAALRHRRRGVPGEYGDGRVGLDCRRRGVVEVAAFAAQRMGGGGEDLGGEGQRRQRERRRRGLGHRSG